MSAAATEDTAFKGAVTATDVDIATNGDKLAYSLGTAATKGTAVVAADGTYTYTPNADYNGADSFTVTVKDSAGASATQTVNVTVAAVNDAPVFATPTVAVAAVQGAVTKGTAVATDVDVATNGDKLTYAVGTAPTNGVAVVNADGTYTYTPTATFTGTDSFVVKVSDTAGLAATQTVTLTITPPPPLSLDTDNDANLSTRFTINATSAPDIFTENGNTANTVTLVGFNAAQDVIQVAGVPKAAYSFSSSGSDVLISLNNAGVVSDIRLQGVLPAGSTALITNEASAEAALGGNFFQVSTAPGGPASTTSADVGTSTPVALNGNSGAVTFTDNAASPTNVVISNFTGDDVIRVTGATAGQYAFTSGSFDGGTTGNDLQISFNNTTAGVVNTIVILNVVDPNTLVFNQATAVSALGYNFITFG